MTVAALSLRTQAVAQESQRGAAEQVSSPDAEQVSSPDAEQVPELTLKDVQAALSTVEENSEIEDTLKGLLRSKYQQAGTALQAATGNSQKATEYREAMSRAPQVTAELRQQLQELPPAERGAEITEFGNLEDLQQELNVKRGELAALNEQLSSVTDELSDGERRPAGISVRIPDAQRELSEVRQRLALEDFSNNDPSDETVADRILLQAQEAKLLSELEALTQEQLSISVRRRLQQTQKELLSQRVENLSTTIAAYETAMAKSVTKQARDIAARVAELEAELSAGHPALELVNEVKALSQELANSLRDKQSISTATETTTTKLQRLAQRHEGISKQLELGQADRAMAESLLKLRDLLNRHERQVTQPPQWPTLSQTRLAAVGVDAAIAREDDIQAQFAEESSSTIKELIDARREVLGKLQDHYSELLPELASLETQQKLYSDEIDAVQDDISKNLIWMRVSPPVNVQTLTQTPSGLLWVLSPTHAVEITRSMWGAMLETPYSSAAFLLLSFGLMLIRPGIRGALKLAGEGVGRVAKDHYGLTARAAFWTVLLALPLPLLAGFVAVTLPLPDTSLNWQRGICVGMRLLTGSILAASIVAACCSPGGLGPQHFGWQTEHVGWLRRGCYWFLIVYVPFSLLTYCTLFSEASEYLDSTGRVSFVLIHVWLAIFLVRLFYSPSGIHARIIREHHVTLLQHLGAAIAIALPIGLVGLACAGYTVAALRLSYLLALTLSMIAGIAILYGLVLRRFKIVHRRLALAEAIERRRARQEAVVAEEQQEGAEDEIIVVDEDDQELDIDTIDDQTRHLLRLFFGLGTATAVLSLWSETLPLIEYFESVTIPMMSELTLLDVTKAILIVVITWIVTRNLPGVLELALRQSTSMHVGTRNAITTIGQYVLIAVGLFLLFNVLKLNWTQFGWIAGGLSVGIGFGMQEVVANFVCGLILLFERPIRVGDVVTVEGELGTVTKIHLRATTVVNFDRGEVVIPNKTLITSTLVNWTLSSPLNRIAIPVGVAYGTDIETARQILLDVAADHPHVVTDPPPVAIFNEFADSSLNILLRVFLPDRNNRESTINSLHIEINKRFAASGIEIPFPQQDLHLRSGLDAGSREVSEVKLSAR
jgi:potassium efflux system protein